jgi:predicted nucleic acid-binding protein
VILADTSVWVDHFRRRNAKLVQLLEAQDILTHPFVIGELALGHLESRSVILHALLDLPQAIMGGHDEVLEFINKSLFGQGLGYVDAHLLASTRLTEGAGLWTLDKRLHRVAEKLQLTARLPL